MAYCEKCKGEHQPKRRIGAEWLVPLWFASIFVTHTEMAPVYCDWIRNWKPAQAGGLTNEELIDSLLRARGGFNDLVHGVVDPETQILSGPPTTFLVLRDTILGDTTRMVTAVSDDPIASVAVGIGGDEDMATVMWTITRESAGGLITALRERLGEPDMDAIAGAEAAEHMFESFQENAIHTHGGDQGTTPSE